LQPQNLPRMMLQSLPGSVSDPASLVGFRLHNASQILSAVQDAENMHLVASDAVEEDVRADKRAAEIGGDFRPEAAEFGKLCKHPALLRECGGVAFGNGRVVLL